MNQNRIIAQILIENVRARHGEGEANVTVRSKNVQLLQAIL